jgi:hypothetical protein
MRLIATGLIALLMAGPALAKPAPVWPQLGVEASIPFPNFGAIRNYEADNDDGIWIEDQQRRWYYGKFMGPCQGVQFAQAIGFDTRGSAQFDKFSKIVVRGDVCLFESFVTAEKPLPRKEREKLRKAREAAAKSQEKAPN